MEYKLIGNYPKRKKGDVAIYTPNDDNFDFKWKDDGVGIPQDLRPDLNTDLFEKVRNYKEGDFFGYKGEEGKAYKIEKIYTQSMDISHYSDGEKIFISMPLKTFEAHLKKDNYFIQEKHYDIISFIRVRNLNHPKELGSIFRKKLSGRFVEEGKTRGFSEESMLEEGISVASGDFEIHSVRRRYDDVIFTIGDLIKDNLGNAEAEDLKGFEVGKDWWGGLGLVHGNKGKATCIITAEKEKQPNFTTEDGIDIYEGDEYWMVNKDFSNVWKAVCRVRTEVSTYHKAFSTKHDAMNYVIFNRPCVSLNDVEEALDAKIDSSLIKYMILSKLKRKGVSNGLL